MGDTCQTPKLGICLREVNHLLGGSASSLFNVFVVDFLGRFVCVFLFVSFPRALEYF